MRYNFHLVVRKKVSEQGISYNGFGRVLSFQFEIPFKYEIPDENGVIEPHENVHSQEAHSNGNSTMQ